MESDSPTASLMETTGLEPLFDFVDGLDRRELGDVMDGLDVSLEALAECVQFNARRYARHLIRSNEQSHVLLICWRSGKRTPLPKMDAYSLTDRHIGEFRPTDFEHALGSGI